MRDFKRHDPGGDSVRDPMDDDQAWEDQIQFVDLDPPGTSSTVGNVLRRLPSPALRMSRRTRWYIAAASIIGLLVLLVQVGYPIWGKLLLDDHILYVGAYDGTIYALHDDGRLLWRYSTKQSVGLLSTANGQLFIQGNSESDSISAEIVASTQKGRWVDFGANIVESEKSGRAARWGSLTGGCTQSWSVRLRALKC